MADLADFSSEQRAMLREIGLPVFWRLKQRPPLAALPPAVPAGGQLATLPHAASPTPAATAAPGVALTPAAIPATAPAATSAPTPVAAYNAPAPARMMPPADSALNAPDAPMFRSPPPGIVQQPSSAWDDEAASTPAPITDSPPPVADVSGDTRAQQIAAMDWLQLEQAVRACRACPLGRGRTQAVFGVGDRQAQWLLIGEGPGRTEDALGEPFVGKSGKLLDNMLGALDLARGRNVYIANIVKCRPTDSRGNDRAPSDLEAAACRPFLERQIALIQPRVMLALGKTAAVALLGMDPKTPVSSLRSRVHRFQHPASQQGVPLVATYHPAYLLRSPLEKAKAWADLCLARQQWQQLAGSVPAAADIANAPASNAEHA